MLELFIIQKFIPEKNGNRNTYANQ